jgi:hypothetical protein
MARRARLHTSMRLAELQAGGDRWGTRPKFSVQCIAELFCNLFCNLYGSPHGGEWGHPGAAL